MGTMRVFRQVKERGHAHTQRERALAHTKREGTCTHKEEAKEDLIMGSSFRLQTYSSANVF